MTDSRTRISTNDAQYILSEVHRALAPAFQDAAGELYGRNFARSVVLYITIGRYYHQDDIDNIGWRSYAMEEIFEQTIDVLDVISDCLPPTCQTRLSELKRLAVEDRGFTVISTG